MIGTKIKKCKKCMKSLKVAQVIQQKIAKIRNLILTNIKKKKDGKSQNKLL